MTDEPIDSVPSETPDAPVPPIESRFLFVDVAALRAKQLRRGALPRIGGGEGDVRDMPHKLERIAMREVSEGRVPFTLPEDGGSKG